MKYLMGNNGIYVDGERKKMRAIILEVFRDQFLIYAWYTVFNNNNRSIIIFRISNNRYGNLHFGMLYVNEDSRTLSEAFVNKMNNHPLPKDGVERFITLFGYFFNNKESMLQTLEGWSRSATIGAETVSSAIFWVKNNHVEFEV